MDSARAHSYNVLAEQAEPALLGPDAGAWLDRLDWERVELEAAIEWLLDHGESPAALAIAARLWRFWLTRGYVEGGRRLLAMVLAAPGTQEANPLRAKALYGAGLLAFRQGDTGESRRLNEEALRVARTADDRPGEVDALVGLARVALREGESASVHALAEEALALARTLPDQYAIATPLHLLAAGTRQAGNLPRARALYSESLAFNRRRGDSRFVAMELLNVAFLELHAGSPWQAEANLREALAISQHVGLPDFVTLCLLGFAGVAAVGGQAPRAAMLLSAVHAALSRSAVVLDPDDQQEYDWCLGLVRNAMDSDAFAAAWATGEDLSAEQALTGALSDEGIGEASQGGG